MKVWDSKHALTSGIKELEVKQSEDFPEMVVHNAGEMDYYLHGEGREWHRTLKSAAIKAENMRIAKIDSLRKQIAKLEALRFEW